MDLGKADIPGPLMQAISENSKPPFTAAVLPGFVPFFDTTNPTKIPRFPMVRGLTFAKRHRPCRIMSSASALVNP
jgi:hypothetical protein